MEPVIELKDICFQYPNSKEGLKDISVEIPKGKKVAILGLNGAGKSTLFLTLCGVLKPNSGAYFLGGNPFRFSKKERQQIGRTVGYVFQDPEIQLFAPTVYDDVAFGLRNMGMNAEEVKREVEKYLTFLNIAHLKNNAPHELSYGQKKMVAIAGVLAMNPQVLIFDEPFAWLDVVQEESMKNIFEKLHQKGKTRAKRF